MPTGYTAPLYEGKPISFSEFAMRCSRGMMALVTMRDEGLDVEIPAKLVPHDYHEKQITEWRAGLAAAESMTEAEAEKATSEAYEAEVRSRAESDRRRSEMRARYGEMLAHVEAWGPPSDDHAGLKKFMLEQLQESIRFDCDEYAWPEPVRLTGAEYKAQRIAEAQEKIAYHEAQFVEECRRCDMRNAWLAALRGSLPNDATR